MYHIHNQTFLLCLALHSRDSNIQRGFRLLLMYHAQSRTTAAHSLKINNGTRAQLRYTAVLKNYRKMQKYEIRGKDKQQMTEVYLCSAFTLQFSDVCISLQMKLNFKLEFTLF